MDRSSEASENLLAIVLSALYLPGLPRPYDPHRARWQAVERALRQTSATLGSIHGVFGRVGLDEEAFVLNAPGLLTAAEGPVLRGNVLTASSAAYPISLLTTLGNSAPPAFWLQGTMPPGPFVGVVGGRRVGRSALVFAGSVAKAAGSLGYSLVSGGADGCDTAAIRAARQAGHGAVEILPWSLPRRAASGVCRLSLSPPGAGFSTAAAMERNALIYAMSDATVVAQARFKSGGTWTGATAALRRRLCRLLVWDDPADRASRALIALGGVPLPNAAHLAHAMTASGPQGGLFVSESRAPKARPFAASAAAVAPTPPGRYTLLPY